MTLIFISFFDLKSVWSFSFIKGYFCTKIIENESKSLNSIQ